MGIFDRISKGIKGGEGFERFGVGYRIGGRYLVYDVLGGGMGVVYVCYDPQSKSVFALKTFKEEYLLSEDAQRLFEREALIWTHLEKHPYIVRAYWVERFEGRLFIILEYIPPDREGRNTLRDYIRERALSYPEILRFSIQFCYGMEHAYSRGIDAHRDIKPDNIMITPDKRVKITDFGLAKAFSEIEIKEGFEGREGRGFSIFKSGGKRVCGTPPYMAPEQFDGIADRSSDIYSFGVVLYEMVSGRIPFIGSFSEYEKLHKGGKIPSLDSPLFPLIRKCMEKESGRRYQDFKEIREELEKILKKETGEVITSPEGEKLEAWERANKGFAFHNIGLIEEAIKEYREAIRINPNLAEAHNNLGNALREKGLIDEAIKSIERLLE